MQKRPIQIALFVFLLLVSSLACNALNEIVTTPTPFDVIPYPVTIPPPQPATRPCLRAGSSSSAPWPAYSSGHQQTACQTSAATRDCASGNSGVKKANRSTSGRNASIRQGQPSAPRRSSSWARTVTSRPSSCRRKVGATSKNFSRTPSCR